MRSSTWLVFAVPRVFMDDTDEDHQAIQPLLSKILFYPLPEFNGTMKTKDWSTLPAFPAPPSSGEGETRWVNPETFFDQLPAVMQQVPPMPGEEALYSWIGSLPEAAGGDPEIAAVLKETAIAAERELIAPLMHWRYNGRAAGNGWNSPVNAADWGRDYLNRAATAKSSMWTNIAAETKYFYTEDDSQGEHLHGQHSYAVTFADGQVPPVRGFWSLTVYNDLHLFEPNQLKRFSLGTKSKNLQYNPDGFPHPVRRGQIARPGQGNQLAARPGRRVLVPPARVLAR